MQYRIITIKTMILILFVSIQSVLAYIPHIPEDESQYKKVHFELENIYEGTQIGQKSDVWGGVQNILFVSSIQEEFGFSPTSQIFVNQPFDDMFFYGTELELPTFIQNVKILSSIEGEFTHFVIEKPLYSKTGIGYEVSDQFALDCTFEAGVYDAEASKAILIGVTFAFE